MSTPQTRRWSAERRHAEPTRRGARAAAVVTACLALVLLVLALGAADQAGLLDGFVAGGWR